MSECRLDGGMHMRTNIEIDDELMRPALAASALSSIPSVRNPTARAVADYGQKRLGTGHLTVPVDRDLENRALLTAADL
jgi:hypothetical protein